MNNSRSYIKKNRYMITDIPNQIQFEIYSNKTLSKKDKIRIIRNYNYENNFEIIEPGSKILILLDD